MEFIPQYFHKDFVAEVAATEPITPVGYDPSIGKFVKAAPKSGKHYSDDGSDVGIE